MEDVRLNNLPGYLTGPEVEQMMYEVGYLAAGMAEAHVARRTGQLAASITVDVDIEKPYEKGGPRWVASVVATAPYAASYEFGHNTTSGRKVDGAHVLRDVLRSLS